MKESRAAADVPGEARRLAASLNLLLDPARVSIDWCRSWQPLACIDLDAWPAEASIGQMPPFPLIGFGSRAHPVAAALDCIVEPRISLRALIDQIRRAPHAATVAVEVLRALQHLPRDPALAMESHSYGMLQGSCEHRAWLAARAPSSPSSAAGGLRIERRGATLHVTIDRPASRNAIDHVLRDELCEAFAMAALDAEIEALLLRAHGACFSSGGDLSDFGTTHDPAEAHVIRSRTSLPAILGERLKILDVHVRGACIGAGLELAAFARRLTATSQAWFQLPELSMGLIPGAGGCVSVSQRIGRQRAALMILSGRRVSAATALGWGLIDAIEDERD